MGNGGYGQFITHGLCCSFLLWGKTPHTLPLLQREVPLMGDSSPQTSPVWVIPMDCSSSQTAPAWILPMGCCPSDTDCSSVDPPWDHKPCQQNCSGMGSSLHRSTGSGRSLLQSGAPHGATVAFRHPPALAWGAFHRLQVDICCTMDLLGLQGDNLPHHGLHHDLEGKTFCSNILNTSSPSFFTDLGVCRFDSHFISLLSNCHLTAVLFFLPFVKSIITEALPLFLIALALASSRSVLEPAGTGCIRYGGSFSQLLTEATPIAPLLPKSCHTNPEHRLTLENCALENN